MKINHFIRNLWFHCSHLKDKERRCMPWAVKLLFPNLIPMKNLVELNVGNFYWRCRGAQSLWAESYESRNSGNNDNEQERSSCIPRLRKCIGCVPRYLLGVYLLRPKLSTANVWFALQEEMRVQIVKQCEGFHTVLMHVILYRIMCMHTELFGDTDSASVRNRIVMSRCFLTFKPYKEFSETVISTLCL